jgi:hypothetical protein
MRRAAIVAGFGLLLLTARASALSVAGQPAEAVVTATVRISSTCVLVNPTAVDFGTLPFSQPGAAQMGTAAVTLSNCSAQNQTILARGTAATGTGATWTHAPPGSDVCPGVNLFIQGVRDAAQVEKRLTVNDQPLKALAGGATETLTLTLVPPCTGSAGAGQAMTVRYIFTGTLAEPGPGPGPRPR